ncbi:MAG: hypothetical protein AAFX06_27495 [Planctomycetota bacterium]
MTPSGSGLERITRRLIRTGKSGDPSALRLLRAELPGVVEQIQRDASRNGPLSYWGRSLNHDEFADQTIVPPVVIRIFSLITGKTLSETTPHAGLQHCYGYLFSNLETPYGYKRERWVETGLEEAFRLHPSTLNPAPVAGTLLANATFFSGLVAFRGSPQLTERLRRSLRSKVSSELARMTFRGINHFRLKERVQRSWRRRLHSWTLQTDVIEAESGYAALIYSVRYSEKRHELVTLFPIDQGTLQTIRERGAGDSRPVIRTRYNAFVPGLVGESIVGRVSSRQF